MKARHSNLPQPPQYRQPTHYCSGRGAEVPALQQTRATLAAAMIAIFQAATATLAQDSTTPDRMLGEPAAAVTPPVTNEPDSIQVPSGGRPHVVTRTTEIPRQLKAAIDRGNCNVTDPLIAKYPLLIFRPADGRRVMAVVPCSAPTPDSRAFLFERSVELEPSPMLFPIVALSGGFSATNQPGLITWEAQTRTLIARRGSDHCPGLELRHTYRQGSGELNGFALSRVEHRRLRCTTPESNWQTLWQSPAWNLQP
jgi:hypothetical protein